MVKIAIVDDNQLLRQTLEKRLNPYKDITITQVCADGVQFLETIHKTTPNNLPEVVLMDIQMHMLDGIETTARAKAGFPHMQFIMLTVTDDEDHIFRAIQAGASGYLLKEEPASVIAQAIQGIQSGEAYISPTIAKKTLDILRSQTPAKKQDRFPTAQEPLPETLSKREVEILEMLTNGYSAQVISEKLFISTHTVQTHTKNIYHKLRVNNKWGAVKMAQDRRWFTN